MTKRVVAAATAAAAALLLGGCTVVGTPQADPAVTALPTDSYSAETGTSTATPATTTADVPPPADATTMTCAKYQGLPDEVQKAVVVANGVTKNPFLVATLVGILCMKQPDATVAAVISSMRDDIIHK